MKSMKKSAYHFGIKLRFYPSAKQKQMIKQNYDAQRFVYNQFVGANRLIYHLKRTSKAKQLNSGLPFVMMKMTKYEIEAANRLIEQQELTAKPKNIRDKYDFLRRKEIDSLAIANAIQNYRKAWRNYRKIGHGNEPPSPRIYSGVVDYLICVLFSFLSFEVRHYKIKR